jgi:hypothetical protein
LQIDIFLLKDKFTRTLVLDQSLLSLNSTHISHMDTNGPYMGEHEKQVLKIK